MTHPAQDLSYLWGCFLNSHKRFLTFMPSHLHSGYKSSWFFSGHILEEGACSWRAACVLTFSWGVGLICEFSGAGILLLTCQCYRQIHRAGFTCEQGFLNLATWGYFRKQFEKGHSETTNTYQPDHVLYMHQCLSNRFTWLCPTVPPHVRNICFSSWSHPSECPAAFRAADWQSDNVSCVPHQKKKKKALIFF